MSIDQALFREQFEVFKERIHRKSKTPFVSFQEGLAQEWEGYKEPNRQRALAALDAASWQKSQIGKGNILERVIAAIEIPKISDAGPANNLVMWHERYGHQSRSHYRLIDACEEPETRQRAEAWAFAFYREDDDPGDAFERLHEITGSRYDLLAYMMFLRDSQRFMPLKVQTFDAAFDALGINLRMSGNCSWENYQQYISALEDVRSELAQLPGLTNVRLVDAHSFCWMLVRPELEPTDELYNNSAKGKASKSRKLNALEVSIFDMAFQAASAAATSNGQQVLITKKNKDLLVPKDELKNIIREQLQKQKKACALTGIRLQFKGDHTDPCRLASLDRIDSNKHYEPGNLQIVCRFINQWKSSMPDFEFRRLLDLVRNPTEAI
jgi:hypothetical protein